MIQSLTLPRLVDLDDPSFDAFAVESGMRGECADPYPEFEAMMRKGSVHKGELRKRFTDVPDAQLSALEHYTVVGYDACNAVLMDAENFTNAEAFAPTLGKSFGRTVTVMDGAEHARYRKVLQKAFLPHTVAKWGDSLVAPVVERLMGAFVADGRADLVTQYTHHFPFQIVYSMLLLEPEQAPVFQKLAVAQLLAGGGHPQGPEATRKLGDFFDVMLRQRRANPGDDLVSHLATIEVDGEHLADEVLISFLRQLVNAGGDTTYRATSVLLACLLSDPPQYEAVRRDRSLLAPAIEEALRWDGPVTNTWRYCKHDTVIDGTLIPAGVIVDVCLQSANRDPRKYDDPHKFDIFRTRGVRHLAFAGGPHICVGQHLARVEMTRAMEALLDQLDNLRLDPDMPPPDIRGHVLRCPDHIFVRFDRRA